MILSVLLKGIMCTALAVCQHSPQAYLSKTKNQWLKTDNFRISGLQLHEVKPMQTESYWALLRHLHTTLQHAQHWISFSPVLILIDIIEKMDQALSKIGGEKLAA